MDIQFENRYFETDQMLREYINKVLLKKQLTQAWVLAAVAGITLLFTLHQGRYVMAAVFGVCLVLMLAIAIVFPILTLREIKATANRITNGQKCETVITFADRISLSEGPFSLTVEYSQLLKRYTLQHSYILMFGKQNGIMLCPNSFTTGTFEDFQAFIEQKMSLAK